MGRRKRSKSKTYHARLRSIQRYGEFIDIEQAINDIKNGQAELIQRESIKRERYVITQNNIRFVVIYDNRGETLVTVLPPEC